MKILAKEITHITQNTANRVWHIKTKPYPADSIHLTGKFQPRVSVWQKIRNFFGLRTKLNPKSFADGSHTPKIPFVKSKKSIDLSNEYVRSNYLSEHEKIIDGFRDGGGNASFDKFGNLIKASREVITVDRSADVYLRNAISYIRQNTRKMTEKQKVKYIYNIIRDISGDFAKGDKNSQILAEQAFGKDILLGKIFEHGYTTCRHKALMFKILAEEAGIHTRMLRGHAFDLGGFGRHVWNEVKLNTGEKFLVDVQNSRIVDLYAKNASKNPKLAGYYTVNNQPIYYKF